MEDTNKDFIKNKWTLFILILFQIIIAVALWFISDYLPGWLKIDPIYSKLVPILIGIISILLAIFVIMMQVSVSELIKNEFENAKILRVISDMQKQSESLHSAHHLLLTVVGLDDPHESYAKDVISDASNKIKLISQDRVPLSEDAFFDSLSKEFQNLKTGNSALAVNAFEINRWTVDPRENIYFDENRKAIDRGASIERIFILNQYPPASDDAVAQAMVLQTHMDIGVQVFVVYRDKLGHRNELMRDVVMFRGDKPRLYEDFQDLIDPTRIGRGELHLSKKSHDDFFEHYNHLKGFIIRSDELKDLLKKKATKEG